MKQLIEWLKIRTASAFSRVKLNKVMEQSIGWLKSRTAFAYSKVELKVLELPKNPYVRLMRLDRPIGILLLLWPALIALWIAAEGIPPLHELIVFVLGVILMRSAGCVINDYADRHFDGAVQRTRKRPLVTGEIAPCSALKLFSVLCLAAFLLVLTLNRLTIAMSVIAVLLAVIYPFMKRYIYFPQLFLGMAFGWAIPMAFTAVTETVPSVGWLLFLGNILWALIYDTFYAMADREDDIAAGVKSTAILFAEDDLMIIAIMQTGLLLLLMLLASQLDMSVWFYLGVIISAGLFLFQQCLACERKPEQCFQAFLNNNWVGAVIFVCTVLHYISR